ncbi:MAG: cell division protein FtsZ [Patescibacteria group bacterium]|nr:cell division protein FtsZ [Patescibacteria group bacterium]MDD5490249.1 cell division protein FtsZ [Patescibacteria group bacterium]
MKEVKPEVETFAKIKVVGVGGSGGSAVNRMVKSNIQGVEFIAINTDVQALHYSQAPTKLQIGKTVTRGLGAGMNADLGRQSAEENQNEIRDVLKGADMVFITCGLGGGTGTGAAPIVAQLSREIGALTVAVVTKPFSFEGAQRRELAEKGLDNLRDKVDTIITIPNDRLLQIIDKRTSLLEAFSIVDNVLEQGVRGISEIITVPGLINVDFADVKAVMADTGSALMGIGCAKGEARAVEAAKAAVSSPLLESSIEGAKGILFTIAGSPDLGMHEVDEAAKIVTSSADPSAKIIFGAVIDKEMKDEVKVTVVATGFDNRDLSHLIGNNISRVEQNNYQPTTFVQSKVNKPSVEEKKEERQPVARKEFIKKPLKRDFTVKSNEFKKNIVGEEDEDLEIPAFIRRKMM